MGKYGSDHMLKKEDFQELRDKTEGYSGADLQNLCREALMIPIREAYDATHFRKVLLKNEKDERYVASVATDPKAIKMSYKEIPNDKLLPKPATMVF